MFISVLCNYSVSLITFSVVQISFNLTLCITLFIQFMTACSAVSVSVRSICIYHSVISEKLSDLVLFSFDHFRRISLWSESIWCSMFTAQYFRKSSSQIMSTRFMIEISEMNFNLIKVFESFFISNLNCFINAFNESALLCVLTWEFQSRLWALKSSSSSI